MQTSRRTAGAPSSSRLSSQHFTWSLLKQSASKYQNILAYGNLVAFIGPAILMLTHNFVYEPRVFSFAVYASIFLVVLYCFAVLYLHRKGLWKPSPLWEKRSKLKRYLTLPLIPFFLFSLYWVNIAIALPWLYTTAFGTKNVMVDLVAKEWHASTTSCRYILEPKSVDQIFFYHCISKNLYDRLPGKSLIAELDITQSPLGYIVEDIRLVGDIR